MDRKKLIEFWIQSASATFGTVVGILLTLGTTYYQQVREQKQMERTAALMVISNLDYYSNQLEAKVKEQEAADSLNMLIWQYVDDNTLDKVSDDTLRLFMHNLTNFSYQVVDNTAENIFTTNIDTWKSIENSEFVEHVGKCFAAKNMMAKISDNLENDRHKLFYDLRTTLYLCDNPCGSLRESVERVFDTPDIVFFIEKLHFFYTGSLRTGMESLKKENAKNKLLMQVSEKELKKFGDHEHKTYKFIKK